MNIVIDLETTIRCPVGSHSGNPMWRGNKIIAAGFKKVGTSGPPAIVYEKGGVDESVLRTVLRSASLAIGHNIKFDLSYLYRNSDEQLPRIWDTQLAEYLLSAQKHLYASLDELTASYLGDHRLKDDEVKAMWKAGIQTEDIPKEKLVPYLEYDVINTEDIFKKQWEMAEQLDLLPLMFTQMDALRATIEMNLNGMRVDWEYVDVQQDLWGRKIQFLLESINQLEPTLDPYSPKQLSLYFFGGKEKYKEKEHVGQYKNGKDKFKLTEKERVIKGKYDASAFEVGKSGYYSVDDKVLNWLVATHGDAIAAYLTQLRECTKIKETYYDGLAGLRFPDGNIYPNLNHCSTKTGRLSSTNPNLQNQTDTGNVKKAYVSRYGSKGNILELDYSQLEMVALAYLANDQQLIDDINNGRDMHKELYKEMYGRYPTDKERKPFKRFSFLLVYGGGVTTLMAQSGCDRATAKRFITTFYKRYVGVKRYHESIVEQAEKLKVVSYDPSKSGPIYNYYHASPTGRHYVFTQYYNELRKDYSFSPTELKNWPIQGFATGDVVPMMVGILLRKLEEEGLTPDVKLIMTVHDSVVLDVPLDKLNSCAKLAKQTLEDAPKYLKSIFNIDFPCQLKVGVEAGLNWQQKEELDV